MGWYGPKSGGCDCCKCTWYTNYICGDWTALAGTWNESCPPGVTFEPATSSPGAILRCDHVLGVGSGLVASTDVEFTVDPDGFPTLGDGARLIFDYVDSLNYWYVEVICDSDSGTRAVYKVRLVEVSGPSGAETEHNSQMLFMGGLSSASSSLLYVRLAICIDPRASHEEVRVSASLAQWSLGRWFCENAGPVTLCTSIVKSSDTVCIGTPSSLVGSVRFLNFAMSRHKSDQSDCPDCGACPNPPCVICTDDFSGFSYEPDWSVVSGSWSLYYSTLLGNASGIVLWQGAMDVGDGLIASVGVPLYPVGTHRLIFDYVDSDNYWAAEYRSSGGSGRVAIVQVTDGSSSTIALGDLFTPTFEATLAAELWVCIPPSPSTATITASVALSGTLDGTIVNYSSVATAVFTKSSDQVGLGGDVAGHESLVFSDFRISRHAGDVSACDPCTTGGGGCQDDCTLCQCVATLPDFIVTISGVDSTLSCTDCEDIDGSYVLSHISYCTWMWITDSIEECALEYIQLVPTKDADTGEYRFLVYFYVRGPGMSESEEVGYFILNTGVYSPTLLDCENIDSGTANGSPYYHGIPCRMDIANVTIASA